MRDEVDKDTASTADKHDAGIRVRDEAPATGRVEDGGAIPAAPPSSIDAPRPGSLQGSKRGIGDVVAGAPGPGEQEAVDEEPTSPRFRRPANSAAAVDSELAESQGLERDLGEEASARTKSGRGEA